MSLRLLSITYGSAIGLLLSASFVSAGTLKQAIDTQVNIDKSAQQSQQKIDEIDDETTSMVSQYRSLLSQIDHLEMYNTKLDNLISVQQEEKQSIFAQLNNIEATQRDIVPLMADMVDVLEQFVMLDTPFLMDERQQRIAALKEMMERADITLSEKYRRVMEAYQIEVEYGRTIEAYQAILTHEDDDVRTVNFLRIGRVALYYITLDSEEAGVWDADKHSWRPLYSSAFDSITQGLKVAKKQLPPELLVLPVVKNADEEREDDD